MSLKLLYENPGFLIRRARQSHVALFGDSVAAFGLTSQQYATLLALDDYPKLSQNEICELVSLDRSTIATLLRRLESKGCVARSSAPSDRRKNLVSITSAGKEMVHRLGAITKQVEIQFLAPLNRVERMQFLATLAKLVRAHDAEASSRARLIAELSRRER